MNCNIKDSSKAWNDGVDAFYKAFLNSKGKRPTEALKFAISEAQRLNPEFEFDSNTLTDPIIADLKEMGKVSKSFKFGEGQTKEQSFKKKVDKMIEKMTGLNETQKKEFAKKAFDKFANEGKLTSQEAKKFYAEALGMPTLNESVEKSIESVSKEAVKVDDIDKEIKQTFKDIQKAKDENNGKLTPEQDKEFETKLKKLGSDREKALTNYINSAKGLAEHLNEGYFWGYTFSDMIRMNLMTPLSLLKNATGMAFDAATRNVSYALASPISQLLLKPFTKINSNPLGARVRGTINSKALGKGKRAFLSGQGDFGKLPPVNHLDAVRQFKKATETMGGEKLKNYIAAVFKIFPDAISRGLSSTDTTEYNRVYDSELSRIAESKGLKGSDKEAFMMDPDERSAEIANERAEKATFRNKLPSIVGFDLNKLNEFDPVKKEAELIKNGYNPNSAKALSAAVYLLRTLSFPFIKTPINIIARSSELLLPEYYFGKQIIRASKETDPTEKQKLYVEAVTNAVVAMHIRYVALKLVGMAAISAGYGDDDEKSRDAVEQKAGGSNRVNIGALTRGLMFMDMTEQKTDQYVDLNSLGIMGITLGAHAHAYNQLGKEDFKKETDYTQSWTNAVSVPANLFKSEFAASLDYTFFSGFNQLSKVAKSRNTEGVGRYAASQLTSVFGGLVSSTVQKISTSVSPNVKKTYDKDKSFGENVSDIFGYRFFFQEPNMRDKYYSLAGEKGPIKKKDYMYFDDMMGRVLYSEFAVFKHTQTKTDGPLPRLYEESRNLNQEERGKLFPSAVSNKLSLGSRGNSVKVKLTPGQHDYLMEKASTFRIMLATPYIMSQEFKKDNYETKTEKLQKYYKQGFDMAKENMVTEYYQDILKQYEEEAKNKTN